MMSNEEQKSLSEIEIIDQGEELPQKSFEEKEKEVVFEKKAKEIAGMGLEYMKKEHDAEGRKPKTYHTSEHPRTLERRGERMADVLHLSSEQRAVVKMEIDWHDTVIEYDEADPTKLLGMIQRHRGAREGDNPKGAAGNEGESARLLEAEMRRANEEAGHEIFSENKIQTAIWGIEATYPDVRKKEFKEYFAQDLNGDPMVSGKYGELFETLQEQGITGGLLFFQPHLEKALEEGKKVPREVLIMALSDLGGPGLASSDEFFKEGDDEMRELYGNLRKPEVLHGLVYGDTETDREDREKVAGAFQTWLNSQPGFAMFQALRFEKIMGLLREQGELTPEEEAGMRQLFGNFENNIKETLKRSKELGENYEKIKAKGGEKVAFDYFARNMHYEIPSDALQKAA